MSGRINYDDKQQGQASTFPTNQQWRYLDANEVKTIVNSHADDIENLQIDVSDNSDSIELILTALQDVQTVDQVKIVADYNLPSAALSGGLLVLYNRSGSTWDVICDGSDTFEGESTQKIYDGETFEMRVDDTGVNWYI